MKYIFLSIFFLGWLAVTVIASVFIIPVIALIYTDWFDLPEKLINKITN